MIWVSIAVIAVLTEACMYKYEATGKLRYFLGGFALGVTMYILLFIEEF